MDPTETVQHSGSPHGETLIPFIHMDHRWKGKKSTLHGSEHELGIDGSIPKMYWVFHLNRLRQTQISKLMKDKFVLVETWKIFRLI